MSAEHPAFGRYGFTDSDLFRPGLYPDWRTDLTAMRLDRTRTGRRESLLD
jgi:hypothetical protein